MPQLLIKNPIKAECQENAHHMVRTQARHLGYRRTAHYYVLDGAIWAINNEVINGERFQMVYRSDDQEETAVIVRCLLYEEVIPN